MTWKLEDPRARRLKGSKARGLGSQRAGAGTGAGTGSDRWDKDKVLPKRRTEDALESLVFCRGVRAS